MEDEDGEEEEERRRVLDAVFGYSSSDCDESNDNSHPTSGILQQGGGKRTWERVEEIRGLWMCREFLNPEQQSWLLSSIDREGWFNDSSHNQAMRFGDLPEWARMLSNQIFESCCGDIIIQSRGKPSEVGESGDGLPLSMDLLWREPLFDQLIANVYQPGEGICAHVDLMRFEDGIAIISLQSSCVMHFTHVGNGQGDCALKIPVFLTPGTLILMSGDARYLWKHEIDRKAGFQVWNGVEIIQQQRTSVTLRKLCQHPSDSEGC